MAFCREMQQHLVLVVPGSGFGLAGLLPHGLLRGAAGGGRGAAGASSKVGAKYFGKLAARGRRPGRQAAGGACAGALAARPPGPLLVAGGLDRHVVEKRPVEVRFVEGRVAAAGSYFATIARSAASRSSAVLEPAAPVPRRAATGSEKPSPHGAARPGRRRRRR